jgi:hypothetical protein
LDKNIYDTLFDLNREIDCRESPIIFMVSSVVKNTSSSVKLFDAVNLTVPVIVTLQAVLRGLESNNGVVINYNTNTNTKYKSLKQIRAIVKKEIKQ